MQAQKGGAIINISTAWDVEPGAIRRCSRRRKIFADTYAVGNVRMNSVLRGWIDNLPAMEERRKSVPMGCYGRADEGSLPHQFPRLERHLHHAPDRRANRAIKDRPYPGEPPGRSLLPPEWRAPPASWPGHHDQRSSTETGGKSPSMGFLCFLRGLALLKCSAIEHPTAFGHDDRPVTHEADDKLVFSNSTGLAVALGISGGEVKQRPDRTLRHNSLAGHLGCLPRDSDRFDPASVPQSGAFPPIPMRSSCASRETGLSLHRRPGPKLAPPGSALTIVQDSRTQGPALLLPSRRGGGQQMRLLVRTVEPLGEVPAQCFPRARRAGGGCRIARLSFFGGSRRRDGD